MSSCVSKVAMALFGWSVSAMWRASHGLGWLLGWALTAGRWWLLAALGGALAIRLVTGLQPTWEDQVGLFVFSFSGHRYGDDIPSPQSEWAVILFKRGVHVPLKRWMIEGRCPGFTKRKGLHKKDQRDRGLDSYKGTKNWREIKREKVGWLCLLNGVWGSLLFLFCSSLCSDRVVMQRMER